MSDFVILIMPSVTQHIVLYVTNDELQIEKVFNNVKMISEILYSRHDIQLTGTGERHFEIQVTTVHLSKL